MAHHGTLRDYTFTDNTDDVRGADVYGRNNEKVGEIDNVIFDHNEMNVRYVVVDSGGWLVSNLFLLPVGVLRASAQDPNAFRVDLDKENIKRFPPYDESVMQSEKDWSEYEKRFIDSWRHACDIAGTELAITGQMDESCLSPADRSGASGEKPAEKPGLWQRFQNLLRRNRKDLQERCPDCQREHKAA